MCVCVGWWGVLHAINKPSMLYVHTHLQICFEMSKPLLELCAHAGVLWLSDRPVRTPGPFCSVPFHVKPIHYLGVFEVPLYLPFSLFSFQFFIEIYCIEQYFDRACASVKKVSSSPSSIPLSLLKLFRHSLAPFISFPPSRFLPLFPSHSAPVL